MMAASTIRRQPHLASTVAYLKHCGADDIGVSQGRHIRIDCRVDGRPLTISMPSSPRNRDDAARYAKQAVRRKLRDVGIEVGA